MVIAQSDESHDFTRMRAFNTGGLERRLEVDVTSST